MSWRPGAGASGARCAGCGRLIGADELVVRDIGRGRLGISLYHQRCAPSLRASPAKRSRRWGLLAAGAVIAGWLVNRRWR